MGFVILHSVSGYAAFTVTCRLAFFISDSDGSALFCCEHKMLILKIPWCSSRLYHSTPVFLQYGGLFSLFHYFIRSSVNDFQDSMVFAEVIKDPGII